MIVIMCFKYTTKQGIVTGHCGLFVMVRGGWQNCMQSIKEPARRKSIKGCGDSDYGKLELYLQQRVKYDGKDSECRLATTCSKRMARV